MKTVLKNVIFEHKTDTLYFQFKKENKNNYVHEHVVTNNIKIITVNSNTRFINQFFYIE